MANVSGTTLKMDWVYLLLMNHLKLVETLNVTATLMVWWLQKQGYADIFRCFVCQREPSSKDNKEWEMSEDNEKSDKGTSLGGLLLEICQMNHTEKCTTHSSTSLSACLSILKPFLDFFWDVGE